MKKSKRLVHFNDKNYKSILNQTNKKCFYCGRYKEYYYIEDVRSEYTLFFDYVAVCERCNNIKGDKSIDEFKHHILDTVKKLQSQYEISLLFELGLITKTNKNVMFYGERIGDILGVDRDIVRNIKNQVAEFYNLDPNELDVPTRKREVVWARQVAHTFSKRKTNASLSFIAQEIGGLHHATILNSIKTVSNEYDTNPRKRKEIDFLSKIFDTVID